MKNHRKKKKQTDVQIFTLYHELVYIAVESRIDYPEF